MDICAEFDGFIAEVERERAERIKAEKDREEEQEKIQQDFQAKLSMRSERGRVYSVDLHPFQPWILASHDSGCISILNHNSQTVLKSKEVSKSPVRSAKFIARKQWVIAGADDKCIHVYNYETMNKVKVFQAHLDNIRSLDVHPSQSYVLSSSDDTFIKLWDWEREWTCTQIFQGHSGNVMQVTFNPKDTSTFASVSHDKTIKIWKVGYPDPEFTLDGHLEGVNCVDYYTGDDKSYLITGSDDQTAKVWHYEEKKCIQTLQGDKHNISAVCFLPDLSNVVIGSEDGTVSIWSATATKVCRKAKFNYKFAQLRGVRCRQGSPRVIFGFDEGTIMIEIGKEKKPIASMHSSGKIIWARDNKIRSVNAKSVPKDFEATNGERLPLAVKELGSCDLYPRSLKHNPNGRLAVVCGDGKYIIYTALSWRNKSSGLALEFVWSSEGEYAVKETTSRIKIFSKNFQEKRSIPLAFSAERIFGGTLLAICSNHCICFYDWAECRLIRRIAVNVKNLYWADSGDLVAIACDKSFYILKYNRGVVTSYLDSGSLVDEQDVEDAFEHLHEKNERVRTGIWVGDCFIYNNSSGSLNRCFGGEVTTMFHLDRPMYLLGYLANQSRVYLIDKEFNVIGYTLVLSLILYKTLVMGGDLKRASEVLPSVPKEHLNSVAHFLESQGMVEDAFEVATDPNCRFDLAIKLGRLEVAKAIASEVMSESKWKQLGELAMSTGKLEMAEECLRNANDLSSLLLIYSSFGDAEGIQKLASLAKEQGETKVAFDCLFMLGKLEDCLQLLVESNQIPEAALMARSYLPSKVSEMVALWRNDLNKVSPKLAESLCDPTEHPNEDWQHALAIESEISETRGRYPPAADYLSCIPDSNMNLLESFEAMQVNEVEGESPGEEYSGSEEVEYNVEEHQPQEEAGD